jgi:hypothetical protein
VPAAWSSTCTVGRASRHPRNLGFGGKFGE